MYIYDNFQNIHARREFFCINILTEVSYSLNILG